MKDLKRFDITLMEHQNLLGYALYGGQKKAVIRQTLGTA